jgi:sulfur carrier protein
VVHGRRLDAPPPRRYADSVIQRTIVTISLNGEPHQLDAPLTVSALLEHLDVDPRRVAVELNVLVVRRVLYATTMVNDGDQVEIVNFVGGG